MQALRQNFVSGALECRFQMWVHGFPFFFFFNFAIGLMVIDAEN